MTEIAIYTPDDAREFLTARFDLMKKRDSSLTQQEFAERAGTHESNISYIRSGRSLPLTDTLDGIFRAMGVTHEYLPIEAWARSKEKYHHARASAELGLHLRKLIDECQVTPRELSDRMGH